MRLRALMNLTPGREGTQDSRLEGEGKQGHMATGNQITIIISADEWIK